MIDCPAVNMGNRELKIGAFLAGMTVLGFWPTLHNGFVGYDDELYVTANALVQEGLSFEGITWAFTTFEGSNWHPGAWLLHMLDCSLFGLEPLGHHAMNLGWHVLSTVLLFALLRIATSAVWPAALATTLFALHPLHVESVAWVAERKDVASAAFGLLSLLLYVLWTRRARMSLYLACTGAFAIGLLIKPMLVTLPFVMLLLDGWPLGRWDSTHPLSHRWWRGLWPRLLEKVPLLVLSVASSTITVIAQSSGGAVESLSTVPIWARLANAALAYGAYLSKTVWPVDLAIHYPHPGTSVSIWLAGLTAALLIGVTWLAARAARNAQWIWVGWCWFLGMLIPVIGLVQVGSQSMADRYTYLPLIGIFIIVAWSVSGIAQTSKERATYAFAGSLVVIVALGTLSWHQLRHWRDGIAVFSHAARVAAPNSLAEYKLGVALAAQGDNVRAFEQYRRAVDLNPNSGSAQLALGTALLDRDQIDQAIECFEIAMQASSTRTQAHNNLGIAMERREDYGKAIVHYRAAIHFDPESTDARINLGVLHARQGKYDKAAREFNRVIELNPRDADAHNNLGFTRWREGKLDEAIQSFEAALRLRPDLLKAQNNLKRVWHERASGVPNSAPPAPAAKDQP